ncbi:MAG: hypothetical protein P8046_09340 [Anaerolineales bacterium]
MSQFQLYLTGVSLSIVLSILVVAYIRRPLYNILTDLCGTDQRARFWAQITHLSFFLVAMLMSITYRSSGQPDYYYLGGQIGRTLLGLVIVTGFLSLTISLFAGKQDKPTLPA